VWQLFTSYTYLLKIKSINFFFLQIKNKIIKENFYRKVVNGLHLSITGIVLHEIIHGKVFDFVKDLSSIDFHTPEKLIFFTLILILKNF